MEEIWPTPVYAAPNLDIGIAVFSVILACNPLMMEKSGAHVYGKKLFENSR
jgi:hypothetical protein